MQEDDKIIRAVKAAAEELRDDNGKIDYRDIEELIRVLQGTIQE